MKYLNTDGSSTKIEFTRIRGRETGLSAANDSHHQETRKLDVLSSPKKQSDFKKMSFKGGIMDKAFNEFGSLSLNTFNDGYSPSISLTADDKRKLLEYANKSVENKALASIALGVLRTEKGAQCWFKRKSDNQPDHGNYIIVTKNLTLAPDNGLKLKDRLLIPVGTAWGGITGRNCVRAWNWLKQYGFPHNSQNQPDWNSWNSWYRQFNVDSEFALYHPCHSKYTVKQFNEYFGEKIIVDNEKWISLNLDLFKDNGVNLIYSSSANAWKSKFIETYRNLIGDMEAHQAVIFANIYWQSHENGLKFKKDLPASVSSFEKYAATKDRVGGIHEGLNLLAGKISFEEVLHGC